MKDEDSWLVDIALWTWLAFLAGASLYEASLPDPDIANAILLAFAWAGTALVWFVAALVCCLRANSRRVVVRWVLPPLYAVLLLGAYWGDLPFRARVWTSRPALDRAASRVMRGEHPVGRIGAFTVVAAGHDLDGNGVVLSLKSNALFSDLALVRDAPMRQWSCRPLGGRWRLCRHGID